MIITFYSYKGGVGRSMALANVAELFYRVGLKVLIVDWDLEAPGLERFFPECAVQVIERPGVIELLLDYKKKMRQPALVASGDYSTLPFATPQEYWADLYPTFKGQSKGALWLLSAGQRDAKHLEEYAYAVRTFDWQDFYENWEGELYFEWLRQQLLKDADVILIDSRTGVSEIGGISTYQLADMVVMLCASNTQNLEGTYAMAQDFTRDEVRELRQGRRLDVLAIPARIEDRSEQELLNQFRAEFAKRLKGFLPQTIGDDPTQLSQVEIPYIPYFAFYERIAVRETGGARSSELARAYGALVRAILERAPPEIDSRDNVQRAIDQNLDRALKTPGWFRQAGEPERATMADRPHDTSVVSSAREAAARPPCPYPGMVPFRAEDARFFYGREHEIQYMLNYLRHQRQLFVIGPSSSGKSSLISAGLVPRLQSSSYFPPGFWLVRMLRPSDKPMKALAQTLDGDPTQPAPSVAALLAVHTPAQRLLLVIDQFEELFTQADRLEQRHFIEKLRALRDLQNCATVIVMRADFYYDLMTSDLWPISPTQRLEITPLRGDALRQAIQQPAADVGVQLEPGLLERLLADAADEPGTMPLIQETMVLLWEQMTQRLLPLSAYERLGSAGRSGLAVAITIKADATLADLPLPAQAIARRIFLRLVQFGEGRADTRRQQPVDALRSSSDDPQRFDQTLQHLTENRLLTLSGEEHSAERRVDLAHEALIAGWPRLQHWLAQHRAAELMRRRLEEKASEWVRLGMKNGGLLDEIELAEAEHWLVGPDADDMGYDALLRDLILASRKKQAQFKRRSLIISVVQFIAAISAAIVANIFSTSEAWRNVAIVLVVLGVAAVQFIISRLFSESQRSN